MPDVVDRLFTRMVSSQFSGSAITPYSYAPQQSLPTAQAFLEAAAPLVIPNMRKLKKGEEDVLFQLQNGIEYRDTVNGPIRLDANAASSFFENVTQTTYLASAKMRFRDEDEAKLLISACQRDLRNKLDEMRSKVHKEVIYSVNRYSAPLNFLEALGHLVTPVEW